MLQENVPPLKLAGIWSHVTADRPDNVSPTVPVTVADALDKTEPSVGEATEREGGVLSMLRVMFTVAISPLASVTVPLTTCPAPSDVMIDDAGQLVIAAVPAVHVKDTVTLL